MDVNLLIKGHDQPADSGKVFERRNPLSQQVASRAAAATVSDADAAVTAASAAFPGWSALGPNARRGLLLKAADALEAKRDAIIAIMMAEIGTTEVWSAFNVKLATGMLREAARAQRDTGRASSFPYMLWDQRRTSDIRIVPGRCHRLRAQSQCRLMQLRGRESTTRA
jgi:acyl-CoA reductase-like NAD-dependent aldehyde dehydrogenase